jgi:hypothetical protein
MAILRSSTGGGTNKPKKKKRKITSADQNRQGRGGVAPANYNPKVSAPPKATPQQQAKPAAFHPFVENIKNAHNAYAEVHNGKKPTAGQMYAMMAAAPKTLSQPEWKNMMQVLEGSPDPVTNTTMKVSVAYFNKFNAYPNAAKMRAFLEAKKGLGAGDQDIETVLNVLGGPTDTKDITIEGQAAERAAKGSGKGLWGWSQADLDSMDDSPAKADAQRKLANRPMRTLGKDWADFTNEDVKNVIEARGWYDGTDFKKFIERKKAQRERDNNPEAFYNGDGTIKRQKILSHTFVGGHALDNILNGSIYTDMRTNTAGVPRSKLTSKQKEIIDNYAETLGASDPTFWNHYGGKKKNVVWDEFFENRAMQFIFLSAIPFATNKKIDKDVRNNAMELIAIASYDSITEKDDLFKFLSAQGSTGVPGRLTSTSDQVSEFKLYAFSKTHGLGMGKYQTLSTYAAMFGKEDLPSSARQTFDTMEGQWGSLTLMDKNPINCLNNVFATMMEDVVKEKVQIPGAEVPIKGWTPEHIANMGAQAELEAGRVSAANTAEFASNKIDPSRFSSGDIEGKRVIGTIGNHRFTAGEDLGAVPTNAADTLMGLYFEISDVVDLAIDRALIFSAGMAAWAKTFGGDVTMDKDGNLHTDVDWNPTHKEFWTGKKTPNGTKVLDSVSDFWDYAVKATPEEDMSKTFYSSPFIKGAFRDAGINPDDHPVLLATASIARELGIGAVSDWGIGAAFKTGAAGAAKLARKSLSAGLKAEIEAADSELATMTKAGAFGKLKVYKGALPTTKDELGMLEHGPVTEYLKAKRTLNMLTRPRWHDTMASALAKSEQDPHVIDKLMNINADRFSDPVRAAKVKKITTLIAESRDEDEIMRLMNRLSFRGELIGGVSPGARTAALREGEKIFGGFGLKLDPGAAMLTKSVKFHTALSESPVWNTIHEVVPDSGTILNGAPKVSEYIQSFGRISRWGGLSPKEAGEMEKTFLRRAYDITGTSPSEINRKRQLLWDEMQETIMTNLSSKAMSNEEIDQLFKWARRNRLTKGASRLEFIDIMAKKGSKGPTQADGLKMYCAIKNHVRRQGLKLEPNADHFFDVFREGQPFLVPNAAGKGGQLAKHLYAPYNMQDMSAYLRGGKVRGWNMFMYADTPIIHYGSYMGVVNATKLLAIARMGFALTAMMVDEIPRLPFEVLNGNMSPNLGKWVNAIKVTKEAKSVDSMSADLINELLHDAEGMHAIDQNHPDYLLWLNGYTELLRDSFGAEDFIKFNEAAAREILGLSDDVELNPAMYREAFKEHLRDAIKASTPDGEQLRRYVQQAGHGMNGKYTPPADIMAAQEAWRQAVNNLYSEIAPQRAVRDDLIAQKNRLLEDVSITQPRGAGGKFSPNKTENLKHISSKPSARFVIDYLDDYHPFTSAVKYKTVGEELEARFARLSLSDEEKQLLLQNVSREYQIYVAGQRGLGDQWLELQRVRAELKNAQIELKSRRSALWHHENDEPWPIDNYSNQTDDWVDALVEKFDLYSTHPELLRSLRENVPVTNKELKAMLQRIEDSKSSVDFRLPDLPIVPGVDQRGSHGVGYIPGLSEWAEGGLDAIPIIGAGTKKLAKLPLLGKPLHTLTSLGPYTLLDKMSNATRRTAFIGNYVKEYDGLIKDGFSHEEALETASNRALEYCDNVMYSPGMTPLESDLKGVVMFLPAYRQAAVYWAKAFMRNPIVMSKMSSMEGSEGLMGWMGPYAQFIPTPFWMTGGNMAEAMLPGLTMPLLLPLRVANTMSGMRRDGKGDIKSLLFGEGRIEYTGATKLDWIGDKIPLLSFMNKGVSPLAGIDDLLWGLFGEDKFLGALGGTNHIGVAALYGLTISLASDPEKRKRLGINITQAQTSWGTKPSLSAAERELRGSPWWYRFFKDTLNMERPEGGLQFLSRTFGAGKISYNPNDLYDKGADATSIRFTGGKAGTIWDEVWGDEEIQSMADADWAMIECYGDEKKMKAILDKYPKYKKLFDFRKLNAKQKDAYLRDDKNQDMFPYVTGKNEYGPDGEMLSNVDYYTNKQAGIIMRKSVDGFLEDIQKTIEDVGWSKKLVEIDKTYQDSMESSRNWLMNAAKRVATNPVTLERYRQDVVRYYNRWTGDLPDNMTADGEYATPPWMTAAAKAAGLDPTDPVDRRKWDCGFATVEYYGRLKAIEDNDTTKWGVEIKGERPNYSVKSAGEKYYSQVRGVEGKWTQGNIYSKDYDDNLGKIVRISAALEKLMPAKYKGLFAIENNMSYGKIKGMLKDRENKNMYEYRKLAGEPGYYSVEAAAGYEAIGINIPDHDKLNKGVEDLRVRYDLFQYQTDGWDTWEDKYLKARAKYINDVDRIYSRPEMEPLRGGPATRIMKTYLGRSGDKLDNNVISDIVRGMIGKDVPKPEDMVDNVRIPKDAKDAKQYLSASAWRSVCLTAAAYRVILRKAWNDSMNSNGNSPESKLGRKYAARLKTLVRAWSERSTGFRYQWELVGGDKNLSGWLDYSN